MARTSDQVTFIHRFAHFALASIKIGFLLQQTVHRTACERQRSVRRRRELHTNHHPTAGEDIGRSAA